MPDPKGITSFKQFLDHVNGSKHADFLGKATSKVAREDAFAEMRAHILKLYEKTEAPHSFVDENGSIFDCIPMEQQPSLKGAHAPIPKAPDLPPAAPAAAGATAYDQKDQPVPAQLGPDKHDKYGNVMQCPAGTIPVRRVTLDDMSRFENLRGFLRKTPTGGAEPPRAEAPRAPNTPVLTGQVAATHRWAHAFQNVSNVGGHSFLNLWKPAIGANQIFSLSQHWYTGGSGNGLQTAEVGWQVYPQFYGNSNPVFFIYWTADGYNNTGCYNLTCSAFVQTNNSWAIGGAIPQPYSTLNGAQYSLEVSFYLSGGRWWLYVKGTQSANAIGYYPVSIYNNGAMAGHASGIDYGGETVGTTSFPPMGSGQFANQGFGKAAYQRQIYYFPTAGGSAWANLTASQSWPNCYTAQVNNYGSPWNESLWFGGPGGNC
jgi:hypothetical protein